MKIAYTNWEGKKKEWDPQTEGVFFVRATRRLEIGDEKGSYFNVANLHMASSLREAQSVAKLLRNSRPDWADAIQAVKAPCVFDAHAGIIVDSWF